MWSGFVGNLPTRSKLLILQLKLYKADNYSAENKKGVATNKSDKNAQWLSV